MQYIEVYDWLDGTRRISHILAVSSVRSFHVGDEALYANATEANGRFFHVFDAARQVSVEQHALRLIWLPFMQECVALAILRGVPLITQRHLRSLVEEFIEGSPIYTHTAATAVGHVFGDEIGPAMIEVTPGTWIAWSSIDGCEIDNASTRTDAESRTHYVRLVSSGRQRSTAWLLSPTTEGLTRAQAEEYVKWIMARWGLNTYNQLWINALDVVRRRGTIPKPVSAPDPSLRRLDLGTEPDVAPTAGRSVAEHGEAADDRDRGEVGEDVPGRDRAAQPGFRD